MAAPNIARLESCKRIPTMQVLAKYADAVGMEINIEVVPIARTQRKRIKILAKEMESFAKNSNFKNIINDNEKEDNGKKE